MVTQLDSPTIWKELYNDRKDEKYGYIYTTRAKCPKCEGKNTGYHMPFLLCHDCKEVVGISETFPA